ncbi:MAG: YkgJ family cysteine cluster protein [archaeon]
MITYKTKKEEIEKLSFPCKCPACENPCRFGSGALVDGDLKKLSDNLGLTEKETKEKYLEEITRFGTTLLKPKVMRKDLPYGKCIFFEEDKGCKVHDAKPTECRIAMGCKDYGEEIITWFHLNYYLDTSKPESVRQYKLYVESGGKVLDGGELHSIATTEQLEKIERYVDIEESRKRDWEEVLGLKEAKNGKQAKDVHKR